MPLLMFPKAGDSDFEASCPPTPSDGVLCSLEGKSAVFHFRSPDPVPAGDAQADAADRLQAALESACSALAERFGWKGRDGLAPPASKLFDCRYEYGGSPKLTATPTRLAALAAIGGQAPTTLSGLFKTLADAGIAKSDAFSRLIARAVDALAPKEAVAETVSKDFEGKIIPLLMASISSNLTRMAMAGSLGRLRGEPPQAARSLPKP